MIGRIIKTNKLKQELKDITADFNLAKQKGSYTQLLKVCRRLHDFQEQYFHEPYYSKGLSTKVFELFAKIDEEVNKTFPTADPLDCRGTKF